MRNAPSSREPSRRRNPHKEKPKMKKFAIAVFGIWLFMGLATQAQEKKVAAPPSETAASQDSGTETVVATFRVQAGKEKDFLRAMQQNWPTLLRLGLVLPVPHILLRGTDDAGKPIFIEILTWVDHGAADHVPAEVQKVWNELQSLCESRGGHSAIDFPEFQIVSLAP
jgi:hypothetical protein